MDNFCKPTSDVTSVHEDAFEIAAGWHELIETDEMSQDQRAKFNVWLEKHPDHRDAYARVERVWMGLSAEAVDDRILAMRREALTAPSANRSRRLWPEGLAASALVGAIGIWLLWRAGALHEGRDPGEFSTGVGQRSNIALSDGSTVVLDTASRIQVAYSPDFRRVRLLAGQAWFEVAKNQPRPFVVEAGKQQVIAHGTAFDVRLEEHNQVQVTLIEGRVSVDALGGSGTGPNERLDHVDMVPGDQVVVMPSKAPTKRKADVTKVTSWRDGQIIFDDDTLAKAVAEINRYSVRKIVVADPALASLRMSGVFIAGHSDSFVETVAGNFSIQVKEGSDGRIILLTAR